MAERRKTKQKRRDDDEPEPLTKEEKAVAKFMRFNIPTREGKLVGMTVQCFIAEKAVDMLMTSKFCKGDKSLFTSRAGCIDLCNTLLKKTMFHRAAKAEKKKKKLKIESEDGPKAIKDEEKKTKKEKKGKKGKDEPKKDEESEDEEKKGKEKELKKEKKKQKKLKLEMHDHQIFKDGDEVYVWIYDPTSVKTFIIGSLLVLGAIGVCLFPLWPPEVRQGVYYLSLVAASFVGFILALCVLRAIMFGLTWCVTFGKLYFWLLPNLTEDVGFFESFVPLYSSERPDITTGEERPEEERRQAGRGGEGNS